MRNIIVCLLFEGLSELHHDFTRIQNDILVWIDSQEKSELSND
ncbi:MAG: hypothetical protein ACTSUT_06550 [Promethearchaeota archaeon]